MSAHQILSPRLLLRTRLRLRAEHHVDTVACWLIERRRNRAAMWLWRACRML